MYLNSQFTAVLNSIICFFVRFRDHSLLVLKNAFLGLFFPSEKMQGFSSERKINKYCCYQSSFIYKAFSQFFEILRFSKDI